MKMETEKYYKTTDLPLAAFLKTEGYRLEPIEVDSKKRVTFVFFIPRDATDRRGFYVDIESFHTNNVLVSPSEYYANLRYLKTLLSRNWTGRNL